MRIMQGFEPIEYIVGPTLTAAACAVCGFIALKKLPMTICNGLPPGIAAAFSQTGKGVR